MTRHNLGFDIIQAFAKAHSGIFVQRAIKGRARTGDSPRKKSHSAEADDLYEPKWTLCASCVLTFLRWPWRTF